MLCQKLQEWQFSRNFWLNPMIPTRFFWCFKTKLVKSRQNIKGWNAEIVQIIVRTKFVSLLMPDILPKAMPDMVWGIILTIINRLHFWHRFDSISGVKKSLPTYYLLSHKYWCVCKFPFTWITTYTGSERSCLPKYMLWWIISRELIGVNLLKGNPVN